MTSVITVAIVCVTALLGAHMWLSFKSGRFAPGGANNWALCPCGHAAALHAEFTDGDLRGGCRSGDTAVRMGDCYGYCKCPATRAQVIGEAPKVTVR